MDEFKLPSLILLRKITCGSIDTIAAVKLLKELRHNSEDVILLFDKIHSQKCEDYIGGEELELWLKLIAMEIYIKELCVL